MLIINKDMNIKQRIQQMDDSKREKLGEVVRFGIVGVAATILQYVIYLVMIPSLAWGLPQLGANDHVLATTANTAPFIGLFGTVWGIMSSFHSIGMLKSASLATVAPGISEALVATAIGLGVAVPATVGFNIFMGRLSQVDTLLVNFAGFFLNRVQRELNAHRPVQRAGATEL